jgi:hypothetical protein
MIRYLGDSSILADGIADALLVVGPNGQVTRAMAPGTPDMIVGLHLNFGGVDNKGRILYASNTRDFHGLAPNAADTALLVRVDMESRRADTLARIRVQASTTMIRNNGLLKFTMEPVSLIDEWAMLSDGSIAVMRGQDYHIDWIAPDGTRHSTARLPFDWKRLTDEDKQKLIDSVRNIEGPRLASRQRGGPPPGGGDGSQGRRGYSPGSADAPSGPPSPFEYVAPAFKDIFDFVPPVRRGALIPDLDGNLWILPTSSAQSKNGELVYDVVNEKGDFHRVRVPLGRSIIGFGKGGVVFLLSGDKTNGFYLEKTRLPGRGSPGTQDLVRRVRAIMDTIRARGKDTL